MRRSLLHFFFFFNDTATTEIYTLSLHDALPLPMNPAPPVTSARMRSCRPRGRRQSAQEIEDGVADGQMADLDETIAVGRHIEIPCAPAAQRIVRREPAHARDRAAGRFRRVDG